jgi:hypothetical protein
MFGFVLVSLFGQRNVGILDKIVQQLSVTQKPGGGSGNANELQMQYDVQVDVVTQLEKRVEQQLNNANSSLPQIVKLKRDFQLVQTRVKTLRSDAQKLREAKLSVGSHGSSFGVNPDRSSASQGGDGAGLQQQQLLMQQDVSVLIVPKNFPDSLCPLRSASCTLSCWQRRS